MRKYIFLLPHTEQHQDFYNNSGKVSRKIYDNMAVMTINNHEDSAVRKNCGKP